MCFGGKLTKFCFPSSSLPPADYKVAFSILQLNLIDLLSKSINSRKFHTQKTFSVTQIRPKKNL